MNDYHSYPLFKSIVFFMITREKHMQECKIAYKRNLVHPYPTILTTKIDFNKINIFDFFFTTYRTHVTFIENKGRVK